MPTTGSAVSVCRPRRVLLMPLPPLPQLRWVPRRHNLRLTCHMYGGTGPSAPAAGRLCNLITAQRVATNAREYSTRLALETTEVGHGVKMAPGSVTCAPLQQRQHWLRRRCHYRPRSEVTSAARRANGHLRASEQSAVLAARNTINSRNAQDAHGRSSMSGLFVEIGSAHHVQRHIS